MVNKVILIGRLGADPEVRYTQDGTMVTNFNMATDEQWKDKNGEKVQKTEWHRIVTFRKLAVLVFFRKDILDILISLIPVGWFHNSRRGHDSMDVRAGRKMALYIITGTVFTGIIGLSSEEKIHHLFTSATTVSFMLLITGALLFMSDRFHGDRLEKDMNIIDSVVIGIVQGISLIPGISRSGSTIAFGIFRGLDGQTAARFSFLLSIPAILGAVVLESKYIGMIPAGDIVVYFTGMIIAAVTGFLTLRLLLFIISKHKLSIFAYYCWILGISTLVIRVI